MKNYTYAVLIGLGLLTAGPVLHAQQLRKAKPGVTTTGGQDREYWSNLLYKIASPVILNLANGTLKQNMPVEVPPGQKTDFFKKVTYLEAVGRTMAGVAPWLALPDDETKEGLLRKKLRTALLKGIANAVDPANPDYLNFRTESQPIVDAAYMAQAFLRAPKALWEPLDAVTKARIAEEFKTLRTRTGAYNNWLLFAGINEAFLMTIGEQPDPARLEFAKRKIQEWYQGDGWYSDGPSLSIDYYNSYVIHPMLVDFFKVLSVKKRIKEEMYETAVKRMVRYSEFSERIIGPDGTYPPMGRSVTYRTAAFQALGQVALMEKLPSEISPAQVRSGLTAVMRRMFDQCDNFDKAGWLVLGFCGSQPGIADGYTSTGSLYMATLGFLPLGLPADNVFWTMPAAEWTAKKAWTGQPFKKDYHVEY
ncbi:hypothetical protein SAMN05421820_108137 [Pedobacter steynii]|uniref:DUF2264 domain-containing protein n=1 Tax=Pedobacter steynii TaxID=430522 RepID=A0A1H0CJE6_9SPHI|nr:DUF2264 domain-containing protein [Pedobacter steynii]NQX41586.1 DUF2264 domain-containing protein [Pedobacter steynii]SDN57996.1 hypothetical protein SAMN05421820_108137 [Pedobacter steynii]